MAVMVRYVRDKPNDRRPHKDGSLPFSAFVVSAQIRKPLHRAAVEIVAIAKAEVGRSEDPRDGHYVDHFSINEIHGTYVNLKYGRSKRSVVQVINSAKNAIAVEIGSGWPSEGITDGAERIAKQGGWNKPMHPLGRAAGKVGNFKE